MNEEMIHGDIVLYNGVSEEKKQQRKQWENVVEKIFNSALDKKIPIKMAFELTPECNLQCKMCYVRLNKDEMIKIGRLLTADEWIEIAGEAAKMGALFITLTGGEALTHPEFKKIYTELAKMGFMIDLFTNGVLIDDEIISLFKEYPPVNISITMYGASRETYEIVCGNGEAYDLMISNIYRIKKEFPNMQMTLKTTLTKHNIDDTAAMKTFAENMGEPLSIGLATVKAVRGANRPEMEEYRLSYDDVRNIVQDYKEKYFVDEETKVEYHERHDKSFICNAGITSCIISWDGRMFPCLTFSSPYTEPLKNGFKSAWEELRVLRQRITVPNRCVNCKWSSYCGTCPAIIQAESGTYIDDEKFNCNYKLSKY